MSASGFVELLQIFGHLTFSIRVTRVRQTTALATSTINGTANVSSTKHHTNHPLSQTTLHQSKNMHCIIPIKSKGHNVHANAFIESKLRGNLLPTLLVTHIPDLGFPASPMNRFLRFVGPRRPASHRKVSHVFLLLMCQQQLEG